MNVDQALELLSRTLPKADVGFGKVREAFEVPVHPDLLAIFVTDRWSAYEFILGYPIPGKGVIQNVMTCGLKDKAARAGNRTDQVAYGRQIDEYLPPVLRGQPEIQKRLSIVDRRTMIKYEIITRRNNLGSFRKAQRDGKATYCGHPIDPTLCEGAEFPMPLSTPTTKAKKGHDEPVLMSEVEDQYPGISAFGVRVFEFTDQEARQARIGRLLDMKIEVARDPVTGEYILCDEISPDSCRFCYEEDYERLIRGERVMFLDKEYGRQYVSALGINNYDPDSEHDRSVVASWPSHKEFVKEMQRRYREGFRICMNYDITEYLSDVWGIGYTARKSV